MGDRSMLFFFWLRCFYTVSGVFVSCCFCFFFDFGGFLRFVSTVSRLSLGFFLFKFSIILRAF